VRGKGIGYAKGAAKGLWKSTGVPETYKKTVDHYSKKGIKGFGGSDNREDREKKWTAKLTGDKGFADRKEQHDMLEKAKKYKDENETVATLTAKCKAGDAAACHRLAEDNDMDSATYADMAGHASISTKLKSTINKKVKQKRADLVATYDVNNANITNERARIVVANPAASAWSDNQIRDHIAEEKM
jgi:hypothetical protein